MRHLGLAPTLSHTTMNNRFSQLNTPIFLRSCEFHNLRSKFYHRNAQNGTKYVRSLGEKRVPLCQKMLKMFLKLLQKR